MNSFNVEPQQWRQDNCSSGPVRRIAMMLDIAPVGLDVGGCLPFGWHFFLLAGETRCSELRADGFPGFGVEMPDLGLPRLLLGGRKVDAQGTMRIGSLITRSSRVANVREKNTPAGRMAIVDIESKLSEVDGPATICEIQTYLLLEASIGKTATPQNQPEITAEFIKHVTPDDTMLFQYSALGFNTHKIHLDRNFARDVEGLPDLVVNGGLATLLVTEALRVDLGADIQAISTRHTAPLYVNREMTIAANRSETGWSVRVFDNARVLAAEMEITCK